MLIARTLVRVCRPATRFYGFEGPDARTGAYFYQYGDSLNSSDRKTPAQLGYQISPDQQELDRIWKTPTKITAVNDHNEAGTTTSQVMESEMQTDNPLGLYDNPDHSVPVNEVKTRIIHVLRHFEKVNLKKLDWDAHIEDGLKFDSLERVALITSIESEFDTVFEDTVFDHFKTLNNLVKHLANDRYIHSAAA